MKGFTLLEMLVVMFVVGIVVSLISVNFSQDPRQALKTEAEHLSLLLQQARDDAITSGAAIAWRSENKVHAFFEMDAQGNWQAMQNDEHFRARQWAPQVQLASMQVNGVKAKPGEALVFSPSGFNLPFTMTLALSDARVAMSGDALGRIKVE